MNIDNQPLISVIVPVFNGEKHVEKCVHSILRQTYPRLELIVINDNSNDGTAGILECLSQEDDRVRLFNNERSIHGASVCRNIGLDMAQGEYIAFVDSDDYVDRDFLLHTLRSCLEEQADISCCYFAFTHSLSGPTFVNTNIIRDKCITPETFWNIYFKGRAFICSPAPWNKLYRASLFSGLRFREGMMMEDLYILPDIITRCSRIGIVSEVLYFYVQRAGSVTHVHQDATYFSRQSTLLARERTCSCFVATHQSNKLLALSLNEYRHDIYVSRKHKKLARNHKKIYKKYIKSANLSCCSFPFMCALVVSAYSILVGTLIYHFLVEKEKLWKK